jgi:hypothetical protein
MYFFLNFRNYNLNNYCIPVVKLLSNRSMVFILHPNLYILYTNYPKYALTYTDHNI